MMQQNGWMMEPWSDRHVIYSTELARVSPFKPMKRGADKTEIRNDIFKNKFGTIEITGPHLGIDDEDVFMGCLKLCGDDFRKGNRVGEAKFTSRQMLKSLGRIAGGSGIKSLEKSIERLQGNRVKLVAGRNKWVGNLIGSYKLDEETGKFVVHIEKDMAQLFFDGALTQIDMVERLELKGDLTKALHRYFNSQRNRKNGNRHEISVKDLMQVVNMDCPKPAFRRSLKVSIVNLKESAFLEYGEIINDELIVVIA